MVGWGVPEEEDQMTAWWAKPATGQGGAYWTLRGRGNRELIVTGIIRLCWQALNNILLNNNINLKIRQPQHNCTHGEKNKFL